MSTQKPSTTRSTIAKQRQITSLNASFFDLISVEVADNVIDYLSPSDIIECICVASTWTCFFYPKLVERVKLESSEQFYNFFSILRKSVKQYNHSKRRKTAGTSSSSSASPSSPKLISLTKGSDMAPNIGYNIRHMVLRGGIMLNSTMQTLAHYCPNVQSSVFLWNYEDSASQRFLTDKRTRYHLIHQAHSPNPFLKPQKRLLSSSSRFTSTCFHSNLKSLTLIKS